MENDIWTIQRMLEWCEGYLRQKGDANPLLSAQWLIGDATSLSRLELYTNFERPLSNHERDILRDYVKRRGAGEPLQYITGEVGFRHIVIKVRPGVLIPRPETEVLVSEALALFPKKRPHEESYIDHSEPDSLESDEGEDHEPKQIESDGGSGQEEEFEELHVADLCTGSGCIACSIAYERPYARIVATDIDEAAVELARENVEKLDLGERVEVRQGDLGEAVLQSDIGTFDLVISNPPYIPTSVLASLPEEVGLREPVLALDGGQNGLDFAFAIMRWAKDALKNEGFLALELHEDALDEAAETAREYGYSCVRIVKDLTDRPRVLTMQIIK